MLLCGCKGEIGTTFYIVASGQVQMLNVNPGWDFSASSSLVVHSLHSASPGTGAHRWKTRPNAGKASDLQHWEGTSCDLSLKVDPESLQTSLVWPLSTNTVEKTDAPRPLYADQHGTVSHEYVYPEFGSRHKKRVACLTVIIATLDNPQNNWLTASA